MTIPSKTSPIAVPVAALLVAMLCFQLGATLAKSLFPIVGVGGTAALRLAIAAVILLAVWRPWHIRFTRQQLRTVIVYGVAMGWMNYFFYLAINYIPLGITMALEFTGPLGIALFASRRPIDFLWIVLAALGLVALLPVGLGGQPLSVLGVAFALGAGACWALYILFGRRAGAAHGGQITSLGTVIGAVMIVPIGYAHSGATLFAPAILPLALGVAVLSSALPYSLEMYALPRIPTRTFGVLMSLNPALGAVAGLFFLDETLTLIQWAAIASIVAASAGSAATRELARN
ncbi:MAG TPA: threonine/homoserine exporter RhtA [Steroidobacteraceae bacterium]|nr:threonine/homoserine exporter RhtA [Steroidobacteraceae bacterium]